MIRFLLLAVLMVCSAQAQVTSSGSLSNNTIYLLMLAPFENESHPKPTFSSGNSLVPAVQLALEHINNSTKILPRHTLDIIIGDSACNIIAEGAIPFLKHVATGTKPVLGIVGPACTEASLFMANLTQQYRYGIVQAMMATSNIFDDHARYRHTFGMVSSFEVIVRELLEIAKDQGWKNIGVLFDQSREFFLRTFNVLRDMAPTAGIELRSYPVLSPVYLEPPLDALQSDHNTRVIFSIMSATTARHVACLAGYKGMTFPRYQFVYADRSLNNFQSEESVTFGDQRQYRCNESAVLRALNGSILLQYGLDTLDNDTVLSIPSEPELTVGDVQKQYKEQLAEYGTKIGEDLTPNRYAYPYYDATWALALSINKTFEELGPFTSSPNSLFINNSTEAEHLRKNLEDLSFQGASVNVTFDKNGHVTNNVNVLQVNEINGTFNDTMEIKGDRINYISDAFIDEYASLHPALIAVGILLTVVTLLFTILLHFISTRFQDYKTIKASSPRINHFIFVSCYIVLLLVFLETIQYGFLVDQSNDSKKISSTVLCNFRPFLLPICLSLIISTVFVKLWRLYSIFNRAFKKQVMLFDKQLALTIVAMQVIILLLNIPWLAVKEAHYSLSLFSETFDEEATKRCTEAICSTHNWLSSLPYLFVAILTIVSFWLAFSNRKIRQTEYRSKETIIFTYLFGMNAGIIFIVLAIGYLVKFSLDVAYSLHTLESLGVVFTCIFALFLPPCYSILKGKYMEYTVPIKRRVTKRLSSAKHLV